MISARAVTKVCNSRPILDGLSVDVKRGECLGITGPAGCGRTTLLQILAARIRPTSGTVTIDGVDAVSDPFRVRRQIAYLDPTDNAGAGLRVGEYVSFVARVRAHETAVSAGKIREAVLRAALKPDMAIDALTPHRRAALAAAAALVVRPDVLLVDDLLSTIEPAAQSRFVDWLSETRQQGSALVVSSEKAADVSALCRRGVQLESGRIAAAWGEA